MYEGTVDVAGASWYSYVCSHAVSPLEVPRLCQTRIRVHPLALARRGDPHASLRIKLPVTVGLGLEIGIAVGASASWQAQREVMACVSKVTAWDGSWLQRVDGRVPWT